MMQVEYEKCIGNGDTVTELEGIEDWLHSNLRDGGIEAKVSKVTALLSIIGAAWLVENQARVQDVASAIGCYGIRHKLRDSDA